MRIRERFNPRAPCGARRYLPQGIRYPHKISTHAPLAGRDGDGGRGSDAIAYFNPRAPCGARPDFGEDIDNCPKFQPTRPLRGATEVCGLGAVDGLISTHTPLAGRDQVRCGASCSTSRISTHAPLAGRDTSSPPRSGVQHNFNPRAPCGARPCRMFIFGRRRYFNPRAPCGARPPRTRR